MKPEHIKLLIEAKRRATTTWRCCSFYYEIAAQYGFPIHSTLPDSFRNEFIDKYVP